MGDTINSHSASPQPDVAPANCQEILRKFRGGRGGIPAIYQHPIQRIGGGGGGGWGGWGRGLNKG